MKSFNYFVLVACLLAGCNPVGDGIVRQVENRSKRLSGNGQTGDVVDGGQYLADNASLNIIKSYGSTIRSYSSRYDLDWRFVLAVIKCESSFDPSAQSHRGAVGFMQIMPATGVEVGRALEIDVLAHPKNNIHGGIYYLRQLYGYFEGAEPTERLKLTLAAYNAGVGRIYDAQDVAAYLHEDPNTWEAVQDALPLLSKRYYTLHQSVWRDGKPRVGWFGSAKETVAYVNKVMDSYEEYRLFLN
jgi:membrane-bound lytic murein transglycosylase F